MIIATTDDALYDAYKTNLEQQGFSIARARSIDDIIELIAQNPRDLIALDRRILGNDIAAVIDRIREREKRMRIVLLYDDDDAAACCGFIQQLPIHACFDRRDPVEKFVLCAASVVKNLPKIDLIAQQFHKIKEHIKLSEKNKEGLRYIISAMPETISRLQPLDTFVRGILIQMCGFLNAEDSFLATVDENEKLILLVGTGQFDVDEKTFLTLPFHAQRRQEIATALTERKTTAAEHYMLIPLDVQGEAAGIFYLEKPGAVIEALEEDMMRLFASQAAITIENSNLFKLATQDGLTGLYVRRHFFERLTDNLQYASRMGGQAVSFIITDIDHFKSINDTYGHPVGDKVLTEVSATLRSKLRATDIIGRIGGEEFAVVLVNTALDEAERIAEQLRAEIKKLSFTHEGKTFSVSMSFGIAGFAAYHIDRRALRNNNMNDHVLHDQKRLLAVADQALYQSKENGRDQVTVADALSLQR